MKYIRFFIPNSMRLIALAFFALMQTNSNAQKIPFRTLISLIGNKEDKIEDYLQASGWQFDGQDSILGRSDQSDSNFEYINWSYTAKDTSYEVRYLIQKSSHLVVQITLGLYKEQYLKLFNTIIQYGFIKKKIERVHGAIENEYFKPGMKNNYTGEDVDIEILVYTDEPYLNKHTFHYFVTCD